MVEGQAGMSADFNRFAWSESLMPMSPFR